MTLPEQVGHPFPEGDLLKLETLVFTVVRHEWPSSHCHHADFSEFGASASGRVSLFLDGCQVAATVGNSVAKSFLPAMMTRFEQAGQPLPRARSEMADFHS